MSRRLLIVDDEPNLLLAVAACLRADGHDVATARNGNEALIHLTHTVPDLIITDIRMPMLDGFGLVRQIRSSPRTELIPIIFLTAKDETSDRIAGFRAGVDAYLTKPFEPDELLAVVASIIERIQRTHSGIARLVGAERQIEQPGGLDSELTETEERIAMAVARGLTNKEIASEFNVSVRTVENHVSHILSKKGFSNRVDIARFVFERNASEEKERKGVT